MKRRKATVGIVGAVLDSARVIRLWGAKIMFDDSTMVRRAGSAISCKISDEIAVLDLTQSVYYGLKGVGAHIWDALEQPRSVAELCSAIEAEVDVASEDCKKDVLQFLASVREAGLIEIPAAAAA